eukprot:1616303-Pleurochrysis_carterae.AAC.1
MPDPRLKFQSWSLSLLTLSRWRRRAHYPIASPRIRWARAVDEHEERWNDMPACMEAMEALTNCN